jgi:hypothetical protein
VPFHRTPAAQALKIRIRTKEIISCPEPLMYTLTVIRNDPKPRIKKGIERKEA